MSKRHLIRQVSSRMHLCLAKNGANRRCGAAAVGRKVLHRTMHTNNATACHISIVFYASHVGSFSNVRAVAHGWCVCTTQPAAGCTSWILLWIQNAVASGCPLPRTTFPCTEAFADCCCCYQKSIATLPILLLHQVPV